ncbi:MAG: ROK family transcriptional regulator [Tropicimonas sp.]|uniref:ROK family transcriptional regulator n=1 Tax=Tropicimonas sp. TaxID=2067044 RepID=UPI003A835C44
MGDQAPRRSVSLTESACAVFRELVQLGYATRPQLGRILGLSRPTMSAAISELEQLGYVESKGAVQGALGRKAVEYCVGAGAGHVISVDAGSSSVQLRVSMLDRRCVLNRMCRLSQNHSSLSGEISEVVGQEIAQILDNTKPDWGPLRMLGIAIPARVPAAGPGAGTGEADIIFSRFTPPEGVDVVLENNVNCAAVAESQYGAATDHDRSVYLQIGLKIGMGLILGGRLIRGPNGAVGEVGHLPYPWGGGLAPEPGAIERHIGADALLERVRADWPDEALAAPRDIGALLRLADGGNPVAARHLQAHAEEIGRIVAAIVCVVDPGLVVLGGGVGASALLSQTVSEVANRLSYPVEIRSTGLGRDATILGIEKLAIEASLPLLLGHPT